MFAPPQSPYGQQPFGAQPVYPQPSAFPPPPQPPPGVPPRLQPYAMPQAPAPAPFAYGQPPAYGQPVSPTPGAGPIPPGMHWAVLLICSWITCGLAGFIFAFRQSSFCKKINPNSHATGMLLLALFAMLGQVVLFIVALSSGSQSGMVTATLLILALNLVILIAMLVAVFGMRKSLVTYYNTVEPINLRLSGAMTFFFNIIYFQYHLARIATWKQTGVLR